MHAQAEAMCTAKTKGAVFTTPFNVSRIIKALAFTCVPLRSLANTVSKSKLAWDSIHGDYPCRLYLEHHRRPVSGFITLIALIAYLRSNIPPPFAPCIPSTSNPGAGIPPTPLRMHII